LVVDLMFIILIKKPPGRMIMVDPSIRRLIFCPYRLTGPV